MGKGDKKTRRGKIWAGSYGNVRQHQARKSLLFVQKSETVKPENAEQQTTQKNVEEKKIVVKHAGEKKTVKKISKKVAQEPQEKKLQQGTA